MNKRIEVEGGELAIRNTFGDFAIIPRSKRVSFEELLNKGDYAGIDKLVSKLPRMANYAANGTVMNEYEGNIEENMRKLMLLDGATSYFQGGTYTKNGTGFKLPVFKGREVFVTKAGKEQVLNTDANSVDIALKDLTAKEVEEQINKTPYIY